MLTGKDYCDYDTCVALKELGYVGSSRYYYTQRDHKFHYDVYNKFYTVRTADAMGYVLAIHLYEAQKWLRKEKGVIVGLHNNFTTREFKYYISTWEEDICTGKKYTDYEDALSDGIKEAIKILKEE